MRRARAIPSGRTSIPAGLLLFLLPGCLPGCRPAPRETGEAARPEAVAVPRAEVASEPGSAAPAPAPEGPLEFAVRGRWADATDLRYRVQPEDGPLPADLFRKIVAEAAARWTVPGRVALRPAAEGEPADVTLSWQRRHHGPDCPIFGTDRSVAHTGPFGPETFVHFDAARPWREAGGTGPFLSLAAAHELGHVLGLDHVGRKDALMFPDPQSPERLAAGAASPGAPTASEWAGIHSLYGGGEPPPGSLAVLQGEAEEPVLVLHGVVPPELRDWTLFDTDSDGADELVTLRTDPAGQGSVTIYHFDLGPVLERTLGPFPGLTYAGALTLLGYDASGDPLLLVVHPDGRYLATRFDVRGFPQPRPNGRLRLDPQGLEDADGDGFLDDPKALPEPRRRAEGDLDGAEPGERLVPAG